MQINIATTATFASPPITAEEVLRRYATGERDFRRANLQGQSFQGQDLSEADFSEADIRGANFSNASLRKANFTQARAGLQRQWAILLVMIALLATVLSGLFPGVVGYFAIHYFIPAAPGTNPVAAAAVLLVYGAFWLLLLRQGIATAMGFVVGTVIVAALGAIAPLEAGAVAVALAVLGSVAVAVTVAAAVAAEIAILATLAGAVAIAGSITLPNLHRAWCSLQGKEKFALFRTITIAFGAIGGTCFRGADLTRATFTKATLKSTNFNRANLTQVCWAGAVMLHCARLQDSYLKHARIRQLVTTGRGQGQNFDRLDLSGINLQGASLQDASFVGANLNHANLRDVDLSRANLQQTQLEGADLSGACLTGAYIEDWGITRQTQFERVWCEYVYLHVPTQDDPDPVRKPENYDQMFEDGNFVDLIQPIAATLDPYN